MRFRLPVALVAALLAGCTTSSLEDATVGMRDTGTYPNLNVPMQAQTAQFSDAERTAGVAALRAARAQHQAQSAPQPGAPVAASATELQRLRATHAQDALREIEAELEDE